MKTNPTAGPRLYRIQVEGHLPDYWSAWFDGWVVTREAGGLSSLTGPVRDQAALYGLLIRVRDLGLVLVSVDRLDPNAPYHPEESYAT